MHTARRQGVLRAICCGTKPSSRMRSRTPFVQRLLRAVINVAYTRFKADKDIAPLLFSIFFAAVINVAYTIFKADKDTMDALIHLRKKTEAGGRAGATSGNPVLE